MIDNLEKIILEYIVSECQDYKVVEIEDFEEYINQKIGKRKININNILSNIIYLEIMKQEKRVVNIRFLFCVFMGLMLGIISNYLFLVKKL